MQRSESAGFAERVLNLGTHRDTQLIALLLLSAMFAPTIGVAVVYVPAIAAVLLAMPLALVYLTRSPTFVVCTVVFITTATYRGLFFAARVYLVGSPISIYDVLWILVFIRIAPLALRRKGDWLEIPMELFATWTLINVGIGLVFHRQLYEIIQYFRAEFYLVIGYLAFRAIPKEKWPTVLRALALGGATTAILQILTFTLAYRGFNIWAVLGVRANTGATYFSASDIATNTATLRDNGVTITFALLAFFVLVASLMTTRRLFPISATIVLLTICTIGILVSLTRTEYFGLCIGTIVIVAVGGLRVARRFINWTIPAFISLLLFGSLLYFTGASAGPVLHPVVDRVDGLVNGTNDQTVSLRLSESNEAWQALEGRWWSGVGPVRIYSDLGGGVILVHTLLHNGYLQYLVNGGVIGVARLALILILGIVAAWRTVRYTAAEEDRLIGLATVSCIVVLVAIAWVGGVVNDAFQSPILGLFLGFAVRAQIVTNARVEQAQRLVPLDRSLAPTPNWRSYATD